MTTYLARLLVISLNNVTIPSDSKIVTMVHIYKGVTDRQSQTIHT
jgi:hypothetical protein